MGKFWDIHTVKYSAAVEMKEVNLTVWIYNKPHNILLSFTKEQSICVRKGCVYMHICLYICRMFLEGYLRNIMVGASMEQTRRLNSRG